MIIKLITSVILFISFQIYAQDITDIQTTDPNYKDITKAVQKGYLSVFNNNEFKPNVALSRRDAAVILSKLNTNFSKSNNHLNHQTINELNTFAASYKNVHASNQNSLISLKSQNENLISEQKILHHEYTKLHQKIDTLTAETKKLKKERQLIYILLASSTVLGFVFP